MDSLEDRVKEIGKIEEERKRKEYLQRLKNFFPNYAIAEPKVAAQVFHVGRAFLFLKGHNLQQHLEEFLEMFEEDE